MYKGKIEVTEQRIRIELGKGRLEFMQFTKRDEQAPVTRASPNPDQI